MLNILKKLEEDKHYYGEFGQQYLSNSDIYSLLKNPRKFRHKEKSLPLLEGGYFHTAMLEPEKLDTYSIMDVSSRATKGFKEYINDNNLDPYDVLLTKEVEKINTWVDAMKSNFEMYTDIYAEGNQYEQPAVATIFGMEWKGKADIITDTKIIDIKTTSNMIVKKPVHWTPVLSKEVINHIIGFDKWIEDSYKKYHDKSTNN